MSAVGRFLGRLASLSGLGAPRLAAGSSAVAAEASRSVLARDFLQGNASVADVQQAVEPAALQELGNEVFLRHRQPRRAAQLWAAAARFGHVDARYSLATYSIDRAAMERKAQRARRTEPAPLQPEDEETDPALSVAAAVAELRALAEAGHGQACHALALLQREGSHDVTKDAPAALANFREAATLGVPPAIHAAATMMMMGEGTPDGQPQVEEAIEWFRLGTEGGGGGDPACHLALGILKADREAHPELFSPEAAFRHLLQAAEAGLPQAKHNAAVALQQGNGCELDPARAAELFADAAKQGYLPSMVNFGIMLAKGEGIPEDRRGARAILERAALEGDPFAREMLDKMGLMKEEQ